MDAYLGQIMLIANFFVPNKWAPCDGQLIDIEENPALFSLLGNTFGGNGHSNFALPDLRGRVALHNGTLPGGFTYLRGQFGGYESVLLYEDQLPSHKHNTQYIPPTFDASVAPGCFKGFGSGGTDPEGKYPGPSPAGTGIYFDSASAVMGSSTVDLSVKTTGSVTLGDTGGNGKHENRQPYLALTYCICINGTYPPRPD